MDQSRVNYFDDLHIKRDVASAVLLQPFCTAYMACNEDGYGFLTLWAARTYRIYKYVSVKN